MSRLAIPLCVVFCLSACGGGSSSQPAITTTTVAATVDAGSVAGSLAPLWGDHYDLSYTHLNYKGDPAFTPLFQSLGPRSLRCSVGRWEVGMTPPTNATSTDTNLLRLVDREYYRGGINLTDADDPSKYDFTWLDAQLTAITGDGVLPFLCFDYMPFTLSSEQSPSNSNNLGATDSALSFSNGIRTAPPASDSVYARVVRNVVRHIRGRFAGTTDFGITHIEVGNEPDLVGAGSQPIPIFWTGSRSQFISMYNAIAAEVAADGQISGLIQLGAGSFAFQPHESTPYFAVDFLADVAANSTRLDFVSYHSYSDEPLDHFAACQRFTTVMSLLSLSMPVVNAEWGRALNGLDPVYDAIEHGLFRAKTMMLLQLHGVQYAHEALLRNPAPGAGSLGILHAGPAAPKPAADVYRALRKFDPALQALPVTATAGQFVLAASSPGNDRVVIAWTADAPGALEETRFDLTVNNLPWGNAAYTVRRYMVSDATNAAGEGVALQSTSSGSGGSFATTVTIPAKTGALILWELVAP